MENILDKLFESTAKARLFKLFFMNPETQFTLEEIIKQTQLKKPAVKKELAKMQRLGILKSRIITLPDVKIKKLKKRLKKRTVKKSKRKIGKRKFLKTAKKVKKSAKIKKRR